MKTPPVLIAVTLLAGFALARAEDATPSAPAGPSRPLESAVTLPLVSEDVFPAAPAAPAEPSLMPPPQESPAPVPTPAPDEATSAKPATPTAGASSKGDTEQLRQAIRIRELKTQVLLNDPAIEAQKKMAACAKTEEGRRILTRNYYTLLYTAMEKLDPSLTAVLETQLYNILLGYEQSKVRPSELIEDVVALPGSHSADHAPAATTATAMKNSAPQTSSAEKTPKPKKFDR